MKATVFVMKRKSKWKPTSTEELLA